MLPEIKSYCRTPKKRGNLSVTLQGGAGGALHNIHGQSRDSLLGAYVVSSSICSDRSSEAATTFGSNSELTVRIGSDGTNAPNNQCGLGGYRVEETAAALPDLMDMQAVGVAQPICHTTQEFFWLRVVQEEDQEDLSAIRWARQTALAPHLKGNLLQVDLTEEVVEVAAVIRVERVAILLASLAR